MAKRPIFVPTPDSTELVKEIFFNLKWHPGFAAVQKEKNIKALHKGCCSCWLCATSGDLYQIGEQARKAHERVPHDGVDQELRKDQA